MGRNLRRYLGAEPTSERHDFSFPSYIGGQAFFIQEPP